MVAGKKRRNEDEAANCMGEGDKPTVSTVGELFARSYFPERREDMTLLRCSENSASSMDWQSKQFFAGKKRRKAVSCELPK